MLEERKIPFYALNFFNTYSEIFTEGENRRSTNGIKKEKNIDKNLVSKIVFIKVPKNQCRISEK